MSTDFRHFLAHACGGRRYCFVVMSYHRGHGFFQNIKQIVAEETGFECLRADDIFASGEIIREKVHAAIESAVFVLADITEARPNIYYEIGYAIARNKPVLLLVHKKAEPPTDLQGMETISYGKGKQKDWLQFESELRHHLRVHKDSNVSLLRAMIIPPAPTPSYLIVHPKKKGKGSRFLQHPREVRTYGDYLGLLGILNAFAATFGEHCAPEIVSAPHTAREVAEIDANLFLIGSPKVNGFTELFLKLMQQGRGPNWELPPHPGEDTDEDYEVQLKGRLPAGDFATKRGEFRKRKEEVDYGLIIRGPHPKHSHRSVMIMAGPHSLGTAAACLAATKSQLVSKVAKKLSGRLDLSTRDRTFWVLTKATAGVDDHVDQDRVQIVDAGVYDTPSRGKNARKGLKKTANKKSSSRKKSVRGG